MNITIKPELKVKIVQNLDNEKKEVKEKETEKPK
jgi:hypothetical protein